MSEPADATTTAAPASVIARRRSPWPRRLWLIGRILTTIGAAVFAISAWTWWWKVEGRGDLNAQYVLLLTPGDIRGVLFPFYFHAMTVLGILLVPFLWFGRRFLSNSIAMVSMLLWVVMLAGFLENQSPFGAVTLIDGLEPRSFTVFGAVQLQAGFLIGLAALLLLFIGGMAMIFGLGWTSMLSREATAARPPLPRLTRLPAAGGLTLGLIIFLIAILGMGWTAVNCTDRPLFLGNCTGLTFPGVLHYGIATQTSAFDPVAALFAIPTLLVGGAVLVVTGLWWWRRLTPGLALWLTLYLATATCCYLVAYAGTGAIALHSGALGLQSGTWTAQSGLWVAALGLLLGWISLVPLWFRAVRPAKTNTTPATT